jgi:hypothetical protein
VGQPPPRKGREARAHARRNKDLRPLAVPAAARARPIWPRANSATSRGAADIVKIAIYLDHGKAI